MAGPRSFCRSSSARAARGAARSRLGFPRHRAEVGEGGDGQDQRQGQGTCEHVSLPAGSWGRMRDIDGSALVLSADDAFDASAVAAAGRGSHGIVSSRLVIHRGCSAGKARKALGFLVFIHRLSTPQQIGVVKGGRHYLLCFLLTGTGKSPKFRGRNWGARSAPAGGTKVSPGDAGGREPQGQESHHSVTAQLGGPAVRQSGDGATQQCGSVAASPCRKRRRRRSAYA
jgi:hypothetical protein